MSIGLAGSWYLESPPDINDLTVGMTEHNGLFFFLFLCSFPRPNDVRNHSLVTSQFQITKNMQDSKIHLSCPFWCPRPKVPADLHASCRALRLLSNPFVPEEACRRLLSRVQQLSTDPECWNQNSSALLKVTISALFFEPYHSFKL